jgi:hypothetical protein
VASPESLLHFLKTELHADQAAYRRVRQAIQLVGLPVLCGEPAESPQMFVHREVKKYLERGVPAGLRGLLEAQDMDVLEQAAIPGEFKKFDSSSPAAQCAHFLLFTPSHIFFFFFF